MPPKKDQTFDAESCFKLIMISTILNNRLLLNHCKISVNQCWYLLSTTISEWDSQKAWQNFKCKIGIYNHPKWVSLMLNHLVS